MELLDKLGIDWKLLLAQIVNFLIILFVLFKFIYKPLLKFLDNRSERIAKSLQDAKQIELERHQLEVAKQEILTVARIAAQEIVKQGEAAALIERQNILIRVKEETQKVIDEARAKIVVEQEVAFNEFREQAARLVAQAMVKIFGKLPVEIVDKKLIDEVIKEVSRRK